MSLHYVLDGYNIIKQSPFFSRKTLKDSRLGLIKFVQENHPCGSKNNQVTVVFDGKADIDFPLTNIPKFLEIIFTKEESAEARIKRIVEKSHNPKRIIVVSDDKEIQFFIRAEGAKVLKSEDFLARGSLKVSSVLKEEDTKIELNSSQAAKITKELERIWLK